MTFNTHEHYRQVESLLNQSSPLVVVTMVKVRGSAPQILGAKAIITSDGIVGGTVGGGKVEAAAIGHAQSLLEGNSGKHCELVTWNLQTDIKMTCGGEVTFFFEVFLSSDWQIAVFGAGHIAQALVPLLLTLQCRITWIDQREDWLSRQSDHARLKKICTQDLAAEVSELPSQTFFVLMTQGHATDLPVLAEVLRTREAPYLGALGSLQKAKILRRDLTELGISPDKIDSYACPMGLPLGNNTPPEIAISIVTQLIQRRDELNIVDHKTKRF
ncbi:MAG: xanthine dehydrogenase accessory protein XdhC [Planctomycetota bacterium]